MARSRCGWFVKTVEVEIRLPRLHPGQVRVLEDARRYNVLACGRRWGKTTLLEDLAVNAALDGQRVGWFAPTYALLEEAYGRMRRTLGKVVVSAAQSPHPRLELYTGGVVEFWTLDDPYKAGRGRAYHLAIVDEAAFAKRLDVAWEESIGPTLTDFRGIAWFASTPRGRNYFFELWARGQSGDPDWASWQMPTSTNPHISAEELEARRRSMPELAWRQEYEAEFVDAEGGVFRDAILNAAFVLEGPEEPRPSRRYVAGVDLARTVDYTDVRILDVTENPARLVAHKRWRGDSWALTVERVANELARYNAWGRVDATGVGDPVFEALRRRWPHVEAVKFTAQVKAQLVERLVVALEQGELLLYREPALEAELRAFRAETSPSGHVKYSAPDGMHDDAVMALALAVQRGRGAPSFSSKRPSLKRRF